MYTVLIQSKRTMDSLQQFYPIFSEAIESGDVGVCQWIESGLTVETAMPELYDLISRKRVWKAMVVSIEPEERDSKYPADGMNPFDFLENKDRTGFTIADGELVDCEAPLIRLAHMLGGIPAPEPQFEATLHASENKIPTLEYHPVNDEETAVQKEAYARWCEEHTFPGTPPAEIILVRVRKASVSRDSFSLVRSSWHVHTEADSSEFWKRNLYPHNCRFLVYDTEQLGVMRQQQDLFKLWTALLLISKNDIDPNVLQAHRLYNLNILLDEQNLAASFQQTINKLNMAKFQLEKSLAQDEADISDTDVPLPEYEVNVPVSFQLPKVSDIHFKPGDYALTGGIGSGDMANWERYSANAKTELGVLLQSTDRILDQAAGRLREQCEYTEAQVTPLTKYQEEDFELSLSRVYKEILREQEALPMGVSEAQEKIARSGEDVKNVINQRMTSKQALGVVLAAVVSLLLCLLPGFLFEQARLGLGIAIAAAALLLGAAGLLILVFQRKALIRAARKFQQNFQSIISELSHNAGIYSDFLSSIASHIHGRSYLGIMKQKRIRRDSSYYFKQKHLKAIDIFLAKLSLWSSALHVRVDLKSVEAIELMDDSPDGIDYESLYSFDIGKNFAVPLNQTGISIASPFGFVERIEIEREEVYDDAGDH